MSLFMGFDLCFPLVYSARHFKFHQMFGPNFFSTYYFPKGIQMETMFLFKRLKEKEKEHR